jgi:hypothetical protein
MQEYIRDNENNINWKWSFNVEMCTFGMPDKPLELWNSHFLFVCKLCLAIVISIRMVIPLNWGIDITFQNEMNSYTLSNIIDFSQKKTIIFYFSCKPKIKQFLIFRFNFMQLQISEIPD